MIREIPINDKQRNLLIKILRDVKQDLEKDNKEVLDRNQHKPNYLHMLNENNKMKIAVDDLLEKLK